MTTRNLDALFAPQSIALIGASDRPGSVGQVLVRNLMSAGFPGPVWLVNRHGGAIGGHTAYADVTALPAAPDLAVVAAPPAEVPAVIESLGSKGCRAAVIITAGLSDPALRDQILRASRPHLLRLVGPNCLGFISPRRGINASFAQLTPRAGRLALVAQSGAVTTAALDWAEGRGLGFSHIVTLGDMADVDFGDLLDYLAQDPATSAIMLYVESITQARKFMSAGRIAARLKPVVVLKAGRSAAGSKAAYSHTGALAGSDLVYEAALRRAGMVRVDTLREMFDAVATLTAGLEVRGDRLTILTNGGGAGVMAADALEARGGHLAPLPPYIAERLDEVLPPTWSKANPVDIIGDAPASRYAVAMDALSAGREDDALLVLNCPTALTAGVEAAAAVADRVPGMGRPVLSCWLGDPAARASRALFAQRGVPTYETPEEAVGAFMHLADRARTLRLLNEVPPVLAPAPDHAAAAKVIEKAALEGRKTLSEPEAKAVLRAYGVPLAESVAASDPAAARAAAEQIPGPYALKILSPDIVHKSDLGGVALNLPTPQAVEEAARDMSARLSKAAPKARLQGFILQSMVMRPQARELIVGVSPDPVFGPMVMFGSGGTEVEVRADRIMGMPPLNRPLALDMIARTRVSRLLGAWRGHSAVALDAVAETIVRIGQLALDFPQLAELDVNPLLADAEGVIALDVRMSLHDPARAAAPAIRPYPQHLTRQAQLADGKPLTVRPVLPQDGPALQRLAVEASVGEARRRPAGEDDEPTLRLAARLSQIDYDREMVFVAFQNGELTGAVRLTEDPEGETGEFALMVRSDPRREEIGRVLIEALKDYATSRGLSRLWGAVPARDARTLSLAERLGFERQATDNPARVRLVLTPRRLKV